MSTRQKVLLALAAVLVVVVFVIGVAGGTPGRGDPRAGNWLTDRLAGFGPPSQDLPLSLVSAECLDGDGSLLVNGVCTLRVADPGGMKTLVLDSAAAFRVAAPAPGGARMTISDTVTVEGGTAQARIAVDRAVDVTVACPGIGTCILAIGGQ